MRLHLQNKIILKKMFISTSSHISIRTEYFAVRSGLEMDLAPVIAMNFMCYKFFLYQSGLSRGQDHLVLPLVTSASIVPTGATNKLRNLNVWSQSSVTAEA